MRSRVLVTCVAAGCASPPAAKPLEYDGHFHIELALDDPNHSAGVQLILHQPDEVTVAMVGDDRASAVYSADGFINFTTFDEAYRLLVGVDGEQIEYQLHAGHLELANRQAGRRHPAPVSSAATEIRFEPAGAPSLSPGSTVMIASTGIWTLTDTKQASVTYSLPWRDARPADSELGLLAADDRVFLYAFEPCSACTAPYRSLTRFVGASFVQSDGQPQTVGDALQLAPNPVDVIVKAPRENELARIGAVFAGGDGGVATWGIDSIPSPALGPIGRLALVASNDPPGATNVDATVSFGNVFAGTTPVGWMELSFPRLLVVSATTTVSLPHGTRQLALVEQGQVALDGMVGVPGSPAIDNQIGSDDRVIALGSADPVVSWTQAIDGQIDDHVVTLFEVVDDAVAPLRLSRTIITDTRSAKLSRDLLVAGHRYVVRVEARLGYPEAGFGNYLKVSYPFATATVWSYAFTVR